MTAGRAQGGGRTAAPDRGGQSIGEILADLMRGQGVEGLVTEITQMGAVPPEPITWKTLVAIEPGLQRLTATAEQARAAADPTSRCGNAMFYGWGEHRPGFKALIEVAVGWGRRPFHPVLSTSAAYDCVVHEIERRMPDCRGGACQCL